LITRHITNDLENRALVMATHQSLAENERAVK